MLTVGLDLRPTEKGFKAHYGRGTGRYVSELVPRLVAAASNAPGVQVRPMSSEQLGMGTLERRLYSMLPYGRHTVEQQGLLPRRVDRFGFDLFHYFAHVDAPARGRTRTVVTVLDLIPLKFADLYRANKPDWRFRFARFLELKAIQRAVGIIAISEATKRDIVELLGVPAERIAVTPLAAGSTFPPRPLEEAAYQDVRVQTRGALSLSSEVPVLLYVGGVDARKNIPFLLRVLAELRTLRAARGGVELLLAGNYSGDDQLPNIESLIERLGLDSIVHRVGYLDEQALRAAYHTADLFVFPSLYEGFGLPVLEAMACGVPVVAANNSSIPEVAGDAALLLPDGDVAAWVEGINGLLEDRERQIVLSGKGVARAKLFSWERTAEETLAAYRRFAGIDRGEAPAKVDARDVGERARLG
ncbi:MAG: glycosyltransferase family 4 protein [Bdellovibrionales bacterium]|nr:glycosyltransferase family 4 protein [Bdellovibrionales bacterium]